MSDTLYPGLTDAPQDIAALHAADCLIAALYALNAVDRGYGKRDGNPLDRLAYQERGTAFQLTVDALRDTLRALSASFDPQGMTLDYGMDCVSDVMGESNPAASVIRGMRDRYESITFVSPE